MGQKWAKWKLSGKNNATPQAFYSIYMKQLKVPFIGVESDILNVNEIGMLLDQQEKHSIVNAPWGVSSFKPEVAFAIAHARKYLLLKYYVRETCLRAANFNYNSPVFEDSCVECFIAFTGEGNYYNLEMNAIGTLLMGYGNGRYNRQLIHEDELKKISRGVAITRNANSDTITWELTIVLPVTVFTHSSLKDFSGSSCRGNFYKCGDRLPDPHFLCWSDLKADQPDFHLPAFFGELHFE
jgi:hypothetical protein